MKQFFLFFLFIYQASSLLGQSTPTDTASRDTLRVVNILNTDRFSYRRVDSVNELQMLAGNVRLKQENTLFFADSAVINNNSNIVEAFGHIHINDNDSIDTYSDYLLYHVDTKIAILKKNVRLTDGSSTLYTDELEYDMNQKIGIYRNGGKVINKTTVLTSREATYYADIKDVYFRDNVVMKDPQYNLYADSLLYNTTSQIATFITKTIIEDSTRRIETTDGYYDLNSKYAYFGKRPIIKDGAVTIIADDVETDDNTGISKLHGNAIFRDTAQGIAILANYIESNKQQGTFFATKQPLMILKQDADSIYIAADTLFSGRLSDLERTGDTVSNDTLSQTAIADSMAAVDSIDHTAIIDSLDHAVITDSVDSVPPIDTAASNSVATDTVISMAIADTTLNDSTNRYFKAYSHVRIFSDSLQAVSDSLFYSGKDSVFQLFKSPIVWANHNQVTGDTIYLYTKNKKANRLYVFENGMVINKSSENMFNQIRGNRLNGYFLNGEINNMRAAGNAESIYYVKDDKDALVGVNRATGDIIDMRFKERELQRVVFISDVKGTMYPITQFPESEKTLRNFKWEEDKRPKTKYELFGN